VVVSLRPVARKGSTELTRLRILVAMDRGFINIRVILAAAVVIVLFYFLLSYLLGWDLDVQGCADRIGGFKM
jgi:hypothetical protein